MTHCSSQTPLDLQTPTKNLNIHAKHYWGDRAMQWASLAKVQKWSDSTDPKIASDTCRCLSSKGKKRRGNCRGAWLVMVSKPLPHSWLTACIVPQGHGLSRGEEMNPLLPGGCCKHYCVFVCFSFCSAITVITLSFPNMPSSFYISSCLSCALLLCVLKQNRLLAQDTFAKVNGNLRYNSFSFIYTIYCIQYFKCQLQCNLHLFIFLNLRDKCSYVLIFFSLL